MAQEGPENSHQGHESPLAHAAEVLLAPDQEQCAWRWRFSTVALTNGGLEVFIGFVEFLGDVMGFV